MRAGGAEKHWACSMYDPELEGELTAALRHVHAALGKDAQDGACSSMHAWQPSPAQLAMLAAWIRQLPPSAVETAINDHNSGVQGTVILQLLDCLHGPCWLHGVHWCLLVLRGMVRSLAGNPCTLLMGTADMSEAAELVRGGQGSATGLQDEVDVFSELESLL